MKFRKLPVEIEAVQWTGENTKELYDFARDEKGNPVVSCGHPDDRCSVMTLEDGCGEWKVIHWADKGDWIIKGVKGEFYACKPDIFEMTYTRDDTKTGAQLIAIERERQVFVEGWTPEHDDLNDMGELSKAGWCYARHASSQLRGIAHPQYLTKVPIDWPRTWHNSWWKPSDDPIRNLVKAGALIAAEIDRLKRIKE